MGLFDRINGKHRPTSDDLVYVFTFKIASGSTEIPPPMVGAYVLAYSTGVSPTSAAKRAWQELRSMGYIVEDMKETGGQISLADWDKHLAERWPEFLDHFPPQSDVLAVIERENAIFSPFAGFE